MSGIDSSVSERSADAEVFAPILREPQDAPIIRPGTRMCRAIGEFEIPVIYNPILSVRRFVALHTIPLPVYNKAIQNVCQVFPEGNPDYG